MAKPSPPVISRSVVVLAALLLLLSSRPAHAYLDPAAGSLLLQLILGGVAGLALILKLFWRRVLTFLRIRRPDDERAAD